MSPVGDSSRGGYVFESDGVRRALLLIHEELRRANDARDAFYREVVDTLAHLRQEDPQRPEDGA